MRPRALALRAGVVALVGVAGCLTDPARFEAAAASSTGGGDATSSSSTTTSSVSPASTSATSSSGTGGGPSLPVHYAIPIGDGPDERVEALVVHPDTNVVFIGGAWEGAFDWQGPQLDGCNGQANHAFVGRIETNGHLGWGDCLGNDATVLAMAFDDDTGTLTAVGTFADVLQWDASEGSISSVGGSRDVFVAQWVDNGTTAARSWFKRFGGPGDDLATGVALSASAIYVVGTFDGTLSVPNQSDLVATAGADIFALSLDPLGTPLYAKRFADTGLLPEVHVSRHAGALWIGGAFNGEITFDGWGKLTSVSSDAFLVRLSDSLEPEKPERFGLGGIEAIHALAAGSDHLGVGGEYGSKLSFKPNNGSPLLPEGPQDAFTALLGLTNHSVATQDRIAAPGEQKTLAASAQLTKIVFAGSFEGQDVVFPFAPAPLMLDAGATDAFVQVWEGTTAGAPYQLGGPSSNETSTAVGVSATLTVVAGTHTAEFDVDGITIGHPSGNGTTGAFVVAFDD